MPRKTLIRVKESPYHVTARCNNKEPFYSSLHEVWNIFSSEIKEITERHECKIHAFVLMPNHFHLLISTPKDDLGIVMQTLLTSVTKKINLNSGRSGRVFGSRYHWSLIDNEQYYDCALKYIYRNPVKAKLIDYVEEYSFSTLKNVLESYFVHYQIEPPVGHMHNVPDNNCKPFLQWLNQPFQQEQELAIKGAFRNCRFTPPRSSWKKSRPVLQGYSSREYDSVSIQKVSDTD